MRRPAIVKTKPRLAFIYRLMSDVRNAALDAASPDEYSCARTNAALHTQDLRGAWKDKPTNKTAQFRAILPLKLAFDYRHLPRLCNMLQFRTRGLL